VVRDERPLWAELAALLGKVNARVVACTPAEIADAADEAGPDLVLLAERVRRETGGTLQRPQLVLREDGGVLFVEGSRPPVTFFSWPMKEDAFLELTARMLRVSERRTFRALIRVLRTRTRESAMGTSQDFSLSGMSFRTPLALERGEPVVISLHLPGGRGSMQLLAEITREAVDPADGEAYYGARFGGLEPEVRAMLRDFVWETR
jgi:hypothetical protein